MKERIISFLSLFTSAGTLLCCALPAAIAAIAGGAAVSAFVSAFPILIPLSKYKHFLFIVSFILIMVNMVFVFFPKGKLACRVTGGKGCEEASRFSKVMFWGSAAIWDIGFFFAYLLVPIMRFFE